MTTALGWQPTRIDLTLSPGADLVFNLPAVDANGNPTTWPAGATSSLLFYDNVKPPRNTLLTKAGIVTASRIDYVVESTETDPILGRVAAFGLYVTYQESPTKEYLVYYGQVQKKG